MGGCGVSIRCDELGAMFKRPTGSRAVCASQTRVATNIGATRFELATSRSRTVRSIQAELRPAMT